MSPYDNLNILEPFSFVKYFFSLHIFAISGFLGTRAFGFPWRNYIMPQFAILCGKRP